MSYYEQAQHDLDRIKRKFSTRLKKIWGYLWYGAPLFIVGGILGRRFQGIESEALSFMTSVAIVMTTLTVMVFISYHLQAFSRRRQSFYRELHTILPGKGKKLGRTHGHHLLEKEALSQMTHRPKRLHEMIIYYSHFAAALVNEGKLEEGVQIAQLLKKYTDDFYTRSAVNELSEYIDTVLAKPVTEAGEEAVNDSIS